MIFALRPLATAKLRRARRPAAKPVAAWVARLWVCWRAFGGPQGTQPAAYLASPPPGTRYLPPVAHAPTSQSPANSTEQARL